MLQYFVQLSIYYKYTFELNNIILSAHTCYVTAVTSNCYYNTCYHIPGPACTTCGVDVTASPAAVTSNCYNTLSYSRPSVYNLWCGCYSIACCCSSTRTSSSSPREQRPPHRSPVTSCRPTSCRWWSSPCCRC